MWWFDFHFRNGENNADLEVLVIFYVLQLLLRFRQFFNCQAVIVICGVDLLKLCDKVQYLLSGTFQRRHTFLHGGKPPQCDTGR